MIVTMTRMRGARAGRGRRARAADDGDERCRRPAEGESARGQPQDPPPAPPHAAAEQDDRDEAADARGAARRRADVPAGRHPAPDHARGVPRARCARARGSRASTTSISTSTRRPGRSRSTSPTSSRGSCKHTCALDVAERGGITLEEVGEIMNLTRERIRQVEVRGLLKLKMGSPSPDELGAELLAQAAAADGPRRRTSARRVGLGSRDCGRAMVVVRSAA